MPEVLFVSSLSPGRTGGGGVAALGTLQALRRAGWSIHLVLTGRAPLRVSDEARALAREVTAVEWRQRRRTPKGPGLRCLLRHGYWPRYDGRLWETLRPLLRSGAYDLLFVDYIQAVECGRLAKEDGIGIPVVFREHNCEFELLRTALPRLRSARLLVEGLARLHRWWNVESHLSRYCDLVLAISEPDAAKLARRNPGLAVEVLPPPVDTDHLRPVSTPGSGKELAFIGGFRWHPNADGLRWFLDEVFPAVRARHPEAHLTAIGAEPPSWLGGRPGVTVAGFVPDERPLLARARVVIAPIRYGSGVRIKILNALALGKAVVSTSIGAEGIAVRDDHSILLADDTASFADAVSRLLEDDAAVARLGQNGLEACLAVHGPDAVARRLDALLHDRLGLALPADDRIRAPA